MCKLIKRQTPQDAALCPCPGLSLYSLISLFHSSRLASQLNSHRTLFRVWKRTVKRRTKIFLTRWWFNTFWNVDFFINKFIIIAISLCSFSQTLLCWALKSRVRCLASNLFFFFAFVFLSSDFMRREEKGGIGKSSLRKHRKWVRKNEISFRKDVGSDFRENRYFILTLSASGCTHSVYSVLLRA